MKIPITAPGSIANRVYMLCNVCLFVCLSACISPKSRVQISRHFLYLLRVVEAQSFSYDSAMYAQWSMYSGSAAGIINKQIVTFIPFPSRDQCDQSLMQVVTSDHLHSFDCRACSIDWLHDCVNTDLTMLINKQGVALTGCNTSGPPCSVTVEL